MSSGIIVVGAGGHAKVCIELLRAMGESVTYCVGAPDSPDSCLGVPVLRGDENLSFLRSKGYSRVFVAVGSNRLRERLGTLCTGQGYHLVNAISPHAVISPSATLGHGVAVMAGAIVNAESVIDDLAIINTGATVDHDCRIGLAAHIAPQCALAGNVTVGNHSFLGVGCKVIPEIRIGERVTVGAGAVVVCHIESDATAVGVPARVLIN
ncbi:NeuD/PglB/VioB family sugar acetyltransferase [Citrobacter sp. Cy070]|uniref:NeuD/PglB/VioB family sugar acetyltransferase n=1 Tax=Citrobacter sp. Cy070 TaxID=2985161 RepID=UPI002575D0F1|nr:NeuD/PglB/VioB family sugar acetyltransferase [Citrobacter sp. Cy070]MDM2732976.1 NeuD/PglB/VioB family sugar acetyltransferase [Citrobacter sp. Cy070]